jgi:hypothetical protein
MTEGDYLLFYQNDHYPYFGRTGHKFNSDVISREYWGNIQADMLYTIKEFKKIDISRKALNEASGYKTNYQPQSIKRMSNKAYRNIRTEYDSVEKLVSNSRRGVESQ